MQKEKILSELYQGNIAPVEKSVVQGSAYQKAMLRLSDIEEKLMAQLHKTFGSTIVTSGCQ